MEPNILFKLKNNISPSAISELSKRYNENEIIFKKGIETAIYTVLIGLFLKIKENKSYETLLNSIEGPEIYSILNQNIGTQIENNPTFLTQGLKPLHMLFTHKKGRISEMISNEIGIQSETAIAVFNLSILLIISHLNDHQKKLKELQIELEEHKINLLNEIPVGIRVLLGYPTFENTALTIVTTTKKNKSFRSSFCNFFKN
jgi:hypothetical protein